TTWYLWRLSADKLQANSDAFWNSIRQPWDIGLTILLTVGSALSAAAMAYAIIDVPSTGNAQLSQRRFLLFRQLPLFLASLLLAAWLALSRNVHRSDLFAPKHLLRWFVRLTVACYLYGRLSSLAVVS